MGKIFTVQEMKVMSYEKYLKTDYWQNIRPIIYERDDYRCRLCNSPNNICVHHRNYELIGEEKLEELITLCSNCHEKFHKKHSSVSYKSFIENKRQKDKAELIENEIIKVNEYIKNNLHKFEILKNLLNDIKFMKYKDFCKELDKINKKQFKSLVFLDCCTQYLNIVIIFMYGKEMRIKYGLPTNRGQLVLSKEIYDIEKDNFVISNILYL